MYEQKDQVILRVTDKNTVTIPIEEYRELINKADRLEIIAESIRTNVNSGKAWAVDDDIVRLMTGTANYTKPKEPDACPNTEAEDE